jgi:hypothetical protein
LLALLAACWWSFSGFGVWWFCSLLAGAIGGLALW